MFTAVPFDNVHDCVYFTFSRTIGPNSQSIDTQDVPPALVLGSRSRSEAATTAIEPYDATPTKTTEDNPPTQFEAFEYQDLANVAETVKGAFDDLTGVSPLWFSVEKDGGDMGRNSFSRKRGDGRIGGGGNYVMFGDWRVEESLVDVFENQPQAQSDKQVLCYPMLHKIYQPRRKTLLPACNHNKNPFQKNVLLIGHVILRHPRDAWPTSRRETLKTVYMIWHVRICFSFLVT